MPDLRVAQAGPVLPKPGLLRYPALSTACHSKTPAAGVVYLLGRVRRQHQEQMTLMRDLEVARTEGAQWRADMRELLEGLSAAIDAQFERWGLTPAEREVALLLLKGLSHKEIAVVREASVLTVRQQARSVYSKANLSGRAALSAFFLEDLLLPADRFAYQVARERVCAVVIRGRESHETQSWNLAHPARVRDRGRLRGDQGLVLRLSATVPPDRRV